MDMLADTLFRMAGVVERGGRWHFSLNGDLDNSSSAKSDDVLLNESLEEAKTIESIKSCLSSPESKEKKDKGHLAWGSVEELLFARDVGYTSVPNSGIYPLGLGKYEAKEEVPIDEHISLRRDFLRQRAVAMNILPVEAPDDLILETRQYDHKKSVSTNPLFSPVPEAIRVAILMKANDQNIAANHKIESASRSRGNSSVGVPGEPSASSSSSTELLPVISHALVDVNKDVKCIQQSRSSTNGKTGCNCHPKKLDKMSVLKLKSELQEHGHKIGLSTVDIQKITVKSDLLSKMREIQRSSNYCDLCISNECECFTAEIGCLAASCSCLSRGLGQTDDGVEYAGHFSTCHNPFGINAYCAKEVKSYRQTVLGICTPVDPFVSSENICVPKRVRALSESSGVKEGRIRSSSGSIDESSGAAAEMMIDNQVLSTDSKSIEVEKNIGIAERTKNANNHSAVDEHITIPEACDNVVGIDPPHKPKKSKPKRGRSRSMHDEAKPPTSPHMVTPPSSQSPSKDPAILSNKLKSLLGVSSPPPSS